MGKRGGNVRIVPMAEGHIESFRACLDAVVRERRYLAMTRAPPLEMVREFIRPRLAQGAPQFVALDGRRVIGWCDIFPDEREGFRHSGRLGMGVLRAYRGRGLGTRLARVTIEKAKHRGLERIELEVFASNDPAIALYKKLGFAVEGLKRKALKRDGIYDDVIQMAVLF